VTLRSEKTKKPASKRITELLKRGGEERHKVVKRGVKPESMSG
jgi:hypothetical protein